ncbi:MAG TPA: TolC family protein [Gemmatimonas aurantiaca]|uniref:TolC family protein n=1 Tax=Gemmatimonas aurantiaca TaxID=173480 RepID=A0A3D4VBC9_9BACT|nr:TolC family protein [Gemmatimonas aurantiaca]HCT58416.1 TolC family protein [Gemmatimonas aurantiaca]
MRRLYTLTLGAIVGSVGAGALAPVPASAQPDSARTSVASPNRSTSALLGALVDTSGTPYTFPEFVDEVLGHHPVAQQARLVAEQARAELRSAWGAFDPKVSAKWDQKRSGGTEYYNYLNTELKIPLPIGADVTLAYDRTMGRYFNPDRRTDGNGTFAAGISIPLGQRIVTDERRTALQQARAARDAGDAERLGIVNKLLYAAAKDYGSWYEAWRRRAIAQEGEALAAFRLQAVRARVNNGESAPIDTVEALLEVQRRQVSRYEAEAAFYLSSLHMTAYLWDPEGRPASLPDAAKPVLHGLGRGGIDSTQLSALVDRAVERNPELAKVQAKIRQASAERLLAAQGILPFAEAKLAGVAERGSDDSFFNRDRLDDNYKAALVISSPLLFLKETGKFNATDAKLDFQRLERDLVRRDIEIDARTAIFDLSNLQRLLVTQEANVRNARLLRDAEQIRFENGESTLLILNLRERLVLDEAGKLASLEAKVASARGALVLATGDRSLLTIP